MRVPIPKGWQGVAAIIASIIAAIAITITLVDEDGDGKPDRIDVVVNAAPNDGVPTKTIEVPEPVVDGARESTEVKDLRDPPEGSLPPSDSQIERSAEVQQQVKPLPEAGAVQGFGGCATRILPTNFSSRNGTRATEFVLHYTVSHNVPGLADVNAIIALFSNPDRQASSNFVIDAEGNCAYIVPIEAKAWTQANGNPFSISVEVIAFGNESEYLGPAGWAKLKSVAQQVHSRTGIPLRLGAISSSCTPIRSGIVQHKDFGLCGGGHVDITPFSLNAAVAKLSEPTSSLTEVEARVVRGVKRPKGSGHTRRFWCQRAVEQKQKLVRAARPPAPPKVGWKVRHRGERFQIIARNHKTHC